MFTRSYRTGFSIDGRTPALAARCTTACGWTRPSKSSNMPGSQMSRSTNSKEPAFRHLCEVGQLALARVEVVDAVHHSEGTPPPNQRLRDV